MDFVSNTLFNGKRLRVLTLIDEFSRECLAIHVDGSIVAADVAEVMTRLSETGWFLSNAGGRWLVRI